MQKVTINPNIAVVVDIDSIGHKEDANIYFKADSNWIGSYDCKIWNSDKKNTQHLVANNLTVVSDLITLKIAPNLQGLEPTKYYYEIWSTTNNRVIFKGNLNIVP